jgi:hypothetical protein
MKRSPGPWALAERKSFGDWRINAKDGYSVVTIPYDTNYGDPETDGMNADLIATAPELYDALATLAEFMTISGDLVDFKVPSNPRTIEVVERMDQLLKRARGQA